MHRVVVIGGGFAGLNAIRALGKLPVEVTLVDRRNFHLFQPLLYQVATGGLSPGDITAPLRAVVRRQKNARVLMAEVTGFDLIRRRVLLRDGGELDYDTLVVATGSENHYFGNNHWEQFAPGLKSIEEATAIRRRILLAFERAEMETDAELRRKWLRFVVVGAGPTGVEMAGAIREIARDTMKSDFRNIRPEECEVVLVEGSARVLPPFPPELSVKAERQLIRLGVRPRTGLRVVAIDEEGVDVESPRGRSRLEARTVIWAAGVRASPLGRMIADAAGARTDRMGRVMVEPDLSVPGAPEVFVIGDLAYLEQDGKPLPAQAPPAMQQGRHVARALRARLSSKPAPAFRYFDKGTMATIGRAAAVCQIGPLKFNGYLAWVTWLFVHLLYIVGFQNRVLVALQWGFQYFTFNRGARLITGEPDEIRVRDREAAAR
jgi:NADH dehydrogenase